MFKNIKVVLIVQCEARYKISVEAGKGVFHMIPGHVLKKKILETFIRFFPSSFNRKYIHTVACTVVFVGPAFCVQRLTLIRAALLSNKNDGPRGRFNCISTVSCKGSVFVEVLTNFYGRFFFE